MYMALVAQGLNYALFLASCSFTDILAATKCKYFSSGNSCVLTQRF